MLKEKDIKKRITVVNALELGEIEGDAKGKGRRFVSRFIEPGLAHYEEFGDVLITKETFDKFVQTMVGCPVIIKHKDITDANVDEERVGIVSRVWYNEADGWFYCEGIIWNKDAIDLVKNQGWSVSCTYDFDSDFVSGSYHGTKYDMEFTGGEFLHLALVDNPRYERANIVMNAKDNEKGRWVTIKGTHVFIPDGKQIEDVMKEKGWFSEGKEKGRWEKSKYGNDWQMEVGDKSVRLHAKKEDGYYVNVFDAKTGKNLDQYKEFDTKEEAMRWAEKELGGQSKEQDDLKGKYSREDVDFDEKQAKKDIEEAKKRGYDTVEKVSEYLGLDEDEVRGFEDNKSDNRSFEGYARDILKRATIAGASDFEKSKDGYAVRFTIPEENFQSRKEALKKRIKEDKRVEDYAFEEVRDKKATISIRFKNEHKFDEEAFRKFRSQNVADATIEAVADVLVDEIGNSLV